MYKEKLYILKLKLYKKNLGYIKDVEIIVFPFHKNFVKIFYIKDLLDFIYINTKRNAEE